MLCVCYNLHARIAARRRAPLGQPENVDQRLYPVGICDAVPTAWTAFLSHRWLDDHELSPAGRFLVWEALSA